MARKHCSIQTGPPAPLQTHLSLPPPPFPMGCLLEDLHAIQFHFVGSSHSLSSVVHASNIDIRQLVMYYYFSVPLLPASSFEEVLTRFFFTLVFKNVVFMFLKHTSRKLCTMQIGGGGGGGVLSAVITLPRDMATSISLKFIL